MTARFYFRLLAFFVFMVLAPQLALAKCTAAVRWQDSLALMNCADSTTGAAWVSNTNRLAPGQPVGRLANQDNSGCPPHPDRDVLIDLYEATNGPNWIIPWDTTGCDVCDGTWYGVRCNASGRVTGLDLDNVPDWNGGGTDGNNLTGTLPSSLGNLTECTFLSFDHNNGLAGPLPATLGNLVNLRWLEADECNLSGDISPLANLTNLRYLSLVTNNLSGGVDFFDGLDQLEILGLADNQFTGSIPANLGNIQPLVSIFLDRNQLTGGIPASLGGLPNLGHLFLYANQLSGPIPAELGNLPNLAQMFLDGNNLSGCIPANLQNLCGINGGLTNNPLLATQSWNNFCNNQQGICCASVHPDRAALIDLYQATNGPAWTPITWDTSICDVCTWPGVVCNGSGRVTELNLSFNNLTGSLPDLAMDQLLKLDLFNNQLSGNVPNFTMPELRELRLFENDLSGPIPDFDLPELRVMFLGQNDFPGPLPDFSGVPKLDYLGFSQCYNLSGPLPNFSNLPLLRVLYLNDMNLSGPVPDLNLPRVEIFQLEINQLDGNLPNFTGMPLVRFMTFFSNNLTGSIPNFSNLPALTNFLCFDNQLEGCYPAFACTINEFNAANNPQLPWGGDHTNFCLGQPQTGASCDDGNAGTTGEVIQGDCSCAVTICSHPDKPALINLYEATNGPNWTMTWDTAGCDVCTWPGIFCIDNRVVGIDLHGNQLTGTIAGLANLDLPYLQTIFLYNNQLSGPIPDFTNLPNLTYLWLFDNQLSGSIPSFSNLTNLLYLSLGGNPLTGPVPNFDLPNLFDLTITGTNVSGPLPDFAGLPKLERMTLHDNLLSGSLPEFDLPLLKLIRMYGNQFTGSIPDFNLPNLVELSLANNQLSGTLPNLALPALELISLNDNNLSGCFPESYLAYCGINYNFLNNPLLAWQGDFSQFCTAGACVSAAESPEAEIKAICFPSPVRDILTVSVTAGEDLHYTLTNLQGIRLVDRKVPAHADQVITQKFELHAFPAGYYLLTIQSERSRWHKLILKK